MADTKKDMFTCVGRGVPKIDALDKALGRAVFSEDISYPGMLFGRVLRAGIPHAVIEGIDVRKARSMKGVACVLTAKDIPRRQPLRPRLSGSGGAVRDESPLHRGRGRTRRGRKR